MVTASAAVALVRTSPGPPKISDKSNVTAATSNGEITSFQGSPKNGGQAVSTQKLNWNYYNSLTNVGTTQEEFVRLKTEGGRKLSQSQGLPEGHYDFSKMSRSEMDVALNDIILNKRAPQSVIDGLTTMANTMPESPSDLFTQAKDSIAFETGEKNTVVANMLKAALDYMFADKALFESTNEARMLKAGNSYQAIADS